MPRVEAKHVSYYRGWRVFPSVVKLGVVVLGLVVRRIVYAIEEGRELLFELARHKSCFLRPDTGPCRADIIQWYYDVKQGRCYRFFWGGCQGNGNRFESRKQCINYCKLNSTFPASGIPHYCSLSFDYGTCFGSFYRWAWDKLTKGCKRYMYSGCGGNQNNFHTRVECLNNCLNPPNNTLQGVHQITTCIPLNFVDA